MRVLTGYSTCEESTEEGEQVASSQRLRLFYRQHRLTVIYHVIIRVAFQQIKNI